MSCMRLDPHSYTDSGQPETRDIDLALRADFQNRMLEGEITLRFREPGGGAIDLDTRELRIDAVAAVDGALLRYELAAAEPILGARLRVTLPAGARGLRIRYRTSPTASALQWLEPSQTAGKEPFLFSQCQPIHARSLAPLQDTPRIRITVGRARFKVPSRLRTLMAAAAKGREDAGGSEAVDLFGPRRRPIAGERDRARGRARLDGQSRHQREREPLLAQRGFHRLRRAADPRGARGPRIGGASRRGRVARPSGNVGALRRPPAAHLPAHRSAWD